MAEENIKLSLDYGTSAKDTLDIAGKLETLKGAAKSVGGEAFGELVSKSIEVGKSFAAISWAADKAEKDTKLSFGELKEHGLELFSAFSEKNASGIITGLADIASLVPPLAPFALGIKAAGAAAATAWPLIKQWVEQVGKLEDTKLENAAGALDKYAKALEKTNAALKESDALTAARAADKAAAEAPEKKQKERAEIFAELTKGREEKTLDEVTEAMDPERADREEKIESIKADYAAKLDAMTKKAKAAGRSDIWIELEEKFLQSKAQKQMDAVGNGDKQQKEAEELLAKAKTGDAKALEKLQQVLPEGSTTREVARMASPEAQDADRAARRDVAEQERRFKEGQARDRARAAANDQVQAQIKADIARKTAETEQQSAAESRGPAAAEKAFNDSLESTRRMSNEIQKRGLEQRNKKPPEQPKLQSVPQDASDVQSMIIMAGNQIGLDASIRADQQQLKAAREELRRLAREARSNINNTRTQQTTSGP
jgi:hypothetical protein